MTDPERLALEVATRVREAVRPELGAARARERVARAPGGDATMAIDEVAEHVVEELLAAEGDIGFYSEDRGLVTYGRPRAFLVIDPVDGTRPAAAGLESGCVSVAVVPPSEDARLGDVSFGVVHELKSGQRFSAARGGGARGEHVSGEPLPLRLSGNTDLRNLFWTAGLRGRPLLPTSVVLEELVDGSSMGGGYFDLGSATFNMTRIVTGQLDAYVDVGRRLVDECPDTEAAFLEVGEGAVCTNFPYDVAAAVLIVQEAGGVATHADGRPLDAHPAVGSSRAHGLAVLAAAGAELHSKLLEAVDRGMHRLQAWVGRGGGHERER
ncbi:MAG TPA: inositol monophosphatase family protein [Acidimicrobiia bacterium]|nr:inositol monophosphatase family protein [Acidimicrobiia bacterium]